MLISAVLLITIGQFLIVPILAWLIALQLRRGLQLTFPQCVSFSIIILGLAGLLMFWISFFGVWEGLFFKLIMLVAVSLQIKDIFVTKYFLSSDAKQLAIPFAFMGISLLFVVIALLSEVDAINAGGEGLRVTSHMANVWSHPLPSDNIIPYIFAEQLRSAEIAKPMLDNWLSSDRPPLQTGMYLLFDISPKFSLVSYQAVSSAFQALIIPATWALCESLGSSKRRIIFSCILLAFSPFVILNTVFVWPKLLAATMLICATIVYLCSEKYKPTQTLQYAAGGTGIALAMLSHGSSAFVILALGLVVLATRRTGNIKQIGAAGLMALVCYLPWIGYQKFYDPPGNRLMKWHLADVTEIDDNSLTTTLSEAYAHVTFQEWLNGRVENLKTVFTPSPIFTELSNSDHSWPHKLENLQSSAFFNQSTGMGIMGAPILLLLFGLFFRVTRPLAAATIIGLIIWCMAMLKPGSTIPHQGSYFYWPALAVTICAVPIGRQVYDNLLFFAAGLQILFSGVLYVFFN